MKRPAQESYYLRSEADAYFKRNRAVMAGEKTEGLSAAQVAAGRLRLIDMARRAGLKPRKAAEVGGSSGYFTAAFQEAFSCEATLVEPSAAAVSYARRKFPNIRAIRGVASDLPFDDDSLDTVIAKGVFCWIGRESLLKAVAEIDRVLQEGGHLLFSDFYPDAPRKTPNRHVPGGQVYCFKTDHSQIFLDSGLYTVVASEIYVDENDSLPGGDLYDVRHQNVILRKSYLNHYRSR